MLNNLENIHPEKNQVQSGPQASHAQMLAIFDGMKDPVYVSDPETYEMLFVNKVLEDTFGSVENKKCYEYLQGRKSPCPFCTNEKIFGQNHGNTHVWEFRNELNGR
jgi:hypothetical protein